MPYLKANEYNKMHKSIMSSEIYMLPSSNRYNKNIKYTSNVSNPSIPCCTGKNCYQRRRPDNNTTTTG
jgi:hypothetical protein